MKKYVLIILLFSFWMSTAQKSTENSCACCTEAHQAFDFWLGEWTVYDTNGTIVGTNTITKEYSNCILKEAWKSSSNNKGTSYNYYNLSDKTWNQVWLDNSGFNLTLKGSYNNKKMVLTSPLTKSEKGNYYNQITWLKNEDGSVTQTWNVLNTNHEKVRETFKGIYKKNVK